MVKVKAIWYPLALAFSEYIDERFTNMVVQQTVRDIPSAYIRVWEIKSLAPRVKLAVDHKPNSTHIRDTILFREDEIWCTNINRGSHHINLYHPRAYESLLDWMKESGLTSIDVVLTGDLTYEKHSQNVT